MSSIFRRAWTDYLQPLLGRPDRFQMAALCYRHRDDRVEVLLITSLDTGRWIIPKGWPMKGLDAADGAAVEAWEEAGVVPARVGKEPLGTFRYKKRMRGGAQVPCETTVFPIEVERLSDEFPHKNKRERRWMNPDEAAELVGETGLRDILASLPSRLSSHTL